STSASSRSCVTQTTVRFGTPQQLYDAPRDGYVARYLGPANLLPPHVIFPLGDPRHEVRGKVACVRPERLTVMPPAAGGLHGTVSSVEWQGA
ncbi:TOBE domain-containing protein, partial [Burkholderia cenocepacia]|nr:TOBE domain-containing protein [Burkholderia cenocepacia]